MYVDIGSDLYHNGEKIEVFPFLPNYRREYLERYEWKTDVLTSFSGYEQRRRLRKIPRRYVEFEVFAQGVDRGALENFMWRQPLSLFAVPDWNNGTRVAPDAVVSAPQSLVAGNFSPMMFGMSAVGGLPHVELKDPLAQVFSEVVKDLVGVTLTDYFDQAVYAKPALDIHISDMTDSAGQPILDSLGVPLFGYTSSMLIDSLGYLLFDNTGSPLNPSNNSNRLVDNLGSTLIDNRGTELIEKVPVLEYPEPEAFKMFGMCTLGGPIQALPAESYSLQTEAVILEEGGLFRHPGIGMFCPGGLIQLEVNPVVAEPSFITIGDTSLTPFISGGYLIGFTSTTDFRLHKIHEVHPTGLLLEDEYTATAGSILYPAMLGRLKQEQEWTRETPNFTQGVVAFNMLPQPSVYDDYTLALPEYAGIPVLEHVFNWDGGRQVKYEFKAQIIDFLTNSQTIYIESPTPGITQSASWFLNGIDKIHDFLGLIHAVAGKAQPFWMPTYSRDLIPLTSSGNRLEVKGTGYGHFGTQDPNHTHLRIEKFTGEVLYCKVLDRLYLTNDVDVLQLNATAGDVSQIKMISFMNVARFDQDLIEIAFKGPGFAQAQTPTRTLKYDL